MATKIITINHNFEGNEIQNVSLQKLSTDPQYEALKPGMIWVNTNSKQIKFFDGSTIRSLFWASGLGNGQTVTGGETANGNLILQSTSDAAKGSILIPEFSTAGFLKNDGTGKITGGNTLSASDIPAHNSSNNIYGAASKSEYGHVKISDGIYVSSGIIGIDLVDNGGLTLSGATPNKKLSIDTAIVATLTDTQTLTNKTLTDPIIPSLYQDVSKTYKISFPAVTDTVVTLTAVQTLTNKTLTTPTINDFTNAGHNHTNAVNGGQLDHGTSMTSSSLLDDDHTQYMLLNGRAGGQTLIGGTASGNNITIKTTSHTTKGKYIFSDLTANGIVKIAADNSLTSGKIVIGDLDSTLFSTDANLGGALTSDSVISSQKAIKTYVDMAITGLSWKQEVVAATTGNITLSGTQTIDGVAVAAGDRVLVKNQTDKTKNGIYIVSTGAWQRAPDADTGDELAKAAVFIGGGNTYANTAWVCSNVTITEWTTEITFVQFTGAASITAGTGISISGNTISIDSSVVTLTGKQTLTNKTLTDPIIPSLYQDTSKLYKISFPAITDTVVTLTATQTLTNKTLTTPSISSFTNATHNHTNAAGGGQLTDAALSSAVGAAKGGTGLTSYTLGDIIYASGTTTLSKLAGNTTTDTRILTQTGTGSASAAPVWKKYKHEQTIGNGTATQFTITHNLNTRACTISVWRNSAPYDEVDYYAEKTDLNNITLYFNRPLTSNEFSVVVIG